MIRGMHSTLYADADARRRRPAGAVRAALRRRALRRRAAARLDARHPLGARVERAAHRRPPPAGQPVGHAAGRAGQPGQGRLRPGGAVHEPDVRPAREPRASRRSPSFPERALDAGRTLAPCAPALLDRCAADGGALAPALAVEGACSVVAAAGRSAACGGGASTSARSSAASTARRSRRGWPRSRQRSAQLRAESAELRTRASQLDSELAMSRSAQATLTKQAAELQNENSQLKEELVFLQQLFADANKQAGIAIQRVAVERERRRRLPLQPAGRPRRQAEGRLRRQPDAAGRAAGRAGAGVARRRCCCPTSSRRSHRDAEAQIQVLSTD